MKRSMSLTVVAAAVAVVLLLGVGGKLSYAATVDYNVDQNDSDLRIRFPDQTDLSLEAPPIKPPVNPVLAAEPDSLVIVKEQTLIPLPPAGWTGLTGLAVLGLGSSFKVVRRFIVR